MEAELLTTFLKEKPIIKIERMDQQTIRVYLKGKVYLEFESHGSSESNLTITLESV